METVANSLVCHANHVLSVAAIRKAHLSTAGSDPCNRCVCLCVSVCMWAVQGAYVCENLWKACISSDNVAFMIWGKKQKIRLSSFLNSGLVVEIGGRCVRATERGVCHVVIVCGNCLIGLMSASNPLTPTKQSNNYYMTHMSTTTHGDTEIYWRVQNKSDHLDF